MLLQYLQQLLLANFLLRCTLPLCSCTSPALVHPLYGETWSAHYCVCTPAAVSVVDCWHALNRCLVHLRATPARNQGRKIDLMSHSPCLAIPHSKPAGSPSKHGEVILASLIMERRCTGASSEAEVSNATYSEPLGCTALVSRDGLVTVVHGRGAPLAVGPAAPTQGLQVVATASSSGRLAVVAALPDRQHVIALYHMQVDLSSCHVAP